MPQTYKTPDVYVEEISVFPPSVAEVGTAIPAFIGYTEKATSNDTSGANDLLLKPTKIYSMKEYELLFGLPYAEDIHVQLQPKYRDASAQPPLKPDGYDVVAFDLINPVTKASLTSPSYLLYYAVKMYFENGGAQCYIVSVGTYKKTLPLHEWKPSTTGEYGFKNGLDAVQFEDEPTLIVIPEAVKLDTAGYKSASEAVLKQCQDLGDRFAIFDFWRGDVRHDVAVSGTTVIDTNRSAWIGALKYGAAYYPFLKTSYNYHVQSDESNVYVSRSVVTPPAADTLASAAKAAAELAKTADDDAKAAAAIATTTDTAALTKAAADLVDNLPASPTDADKAALRDATKAAMDAAKADVDATAKAANAKDLQEKAAQAQAAADAAKAAAALNESVTLDKLKTADTAAYNTAKAEIGKHFVTNMPPSGAVAGVYAATDATRGVWKSPANTSLSGVIEPVVKLTNLLQDGLNVDADTGKSVNAIRSFAGKGTLVWGARTLAGNDNEWRYVSVRRFFNMVEESIKKSTYWAVFEPNDANTWVKVKGMIESYLTDKWRDGALAGATPQDAFFVKCGLGKTMSAQDILEGRMNVEIGMAVVRPAEFIILKFSHKLQTS